MKNSQKKLIKSLVSSSLISGGLALAQNTLAATYYVAPDGNDANAGTITNPFKTITRSQKYSKPGDTVIVRGGTYAEKIQWTTSGSATAPITIKAYPNEKPIIDGQYRLPRTYLEAMVTLKGSYVNMEDFEIRNSIGRGIKLIGHHNRLSRANVHDHASRGVWAAGDYSIVEDSYVWRNAWSNCQIGSCAPVPPPKRGVWSTGLSAARDEVDGVTENAILRRNVVYENWGEGLSSFEARGTILDSNIVYDNWAVNLYISDSANVVVSNNLVYATPNNYVRKQGLQIGLCDETGIVRSENVTIVNNVVKGGTTSLGWWVDPDTPGTYLKNFVIANNTFIDASPVSRWSGAISFRDAPHQNVQFINNIAHHVGEGLPILVDQGDFRFASNLWTERPVAKAQAWNDVNAADPLLTRTGSTLPGQLTGDYFKLKSTSPAINEGSVVGSIVDDFFGNSRDATPDIGGHEF